MSIATIALVTEDALSEALGPRLLAECAPDAAEPLLLRRNGSGYLRKNIHKWVALARRQTVLVLTDLDHIACAPALVSAWLGTTPRSPSLLLRVAVREVESWLLADHRAMRALLGTRARLPPRPDDLPDPKQHLLQLAHNASREVRSDLVKQRGAVASQGIGYNSRLTALVKAEWSSERAAMRSPSLSRTRARLLRIGERAR